MRHRRANSGVGSGREHYHPDEKFYILTLQSVRGPEKQCIQALKYTCTFNCLRPHFGKPMPGKTPSERVEELYPGLTK